MNYPENLPEISINPQRATAKEIAMMAADLMQFRRKRRSFIEWLEKYETLVKAQDAQIGLATIRTVITVAKEML